MTGSEYTIYVEGEKVLVLEGTTYKELAERYREGREEEILLIRENNQLREFRHKVKDQCRIQFLTLRDPAGKNAYERSLLLLMNRALFELSGNDPDYDLRVYFSTGDGLFCRLAKKELVTQELLDRLQAGMRELVRRSLPIEKEAVSTQEAMRVFHERRMYDKEQLFRYRMSSFTNLYRLDGYEDYSYGYMLDNTCRLKDFALTLYDDGFVLRSPKPGTHNLDEPMKVDRKLFGVQKYSFLWGEKIGIRDVGDLNDLIVSGGVHSLILTQEAYHEMQIAQIARDISSDPEKRIILIAGPSSSGKTTFSHRLSAQLSCQGLHPHPIPVDDYFVDRERTPLDENGSYNFEALEAIDIEQFNKDMLGLLAGERVELPTFNFRIGKREYKGKYLQLKPDDVLVIEGIHGLNEKLTYALPTESKFRIYVSALTALSVDEHNRIPSTDGRLIRRIVRDARTRGTSAENTIAMWPSVRRGEEQLIFPKQEGADVMFNSALIYELGVLKSYAEPLLFGIAPESPYYQEAKRLLKFLSYFVPIMPEGVPQNSLLREFVGGGSYDV